MPSADLKKMSAVILAGGKSSRMGRDKSMLLFNGEPLLFRAVNKLDAVFGEIIIVTNQDIRIDTQDKRCEVKVVNDEIPYLGPLGGIGTGLKVSSSGKCFVIAVDMPFISLHVVSYLAALIDSADIVVPRTNNGLEPLFAFYGKNCISAVDYLISHDELKARSLYSLVETKIVEHSEIAGLSGANKSFININTEKNLKMAEAEKFS